MYELLNRIRKLETANLVPEEHLALLHEMAYKAVNQISKAKKEKMQYMEGFFGYKYVIIRTLVENLEGMVKHG